MVRPRGAPSLRPPGQNPALLLVGFRQPTLSPREKLRGGRPDNHTEYVLVPRLDLAGISVVVLAGRTPAFGRTARPVRSAINRGSDDTLVSTAALPQ